MVKNIPSEEETRAIRTGPNIPWTRSGSKHRFYNLLAYYRTSRTIAQRVNGNQGKLPALTIKFEEVVRVKNFLLS